MLSLHHTASIRTKSLSGFMTSKQHSIRECVTAGAFVCVRTTEGVGVSGGVQCSAGVGTITITRRVIANRIKTTFHPFPSAHLDFYFVPFII